MNNVLQVAFRVLDLVTPGAMIDHDRVSKMMESEFGLIPTIKHVQKCWTNFPALRKNPLSTR